MSLILYRSASDGWRVGSAEFSNAAKVLVIDRQTGMKETVRPSDIFIPMDTQGGKVKDYDEGSLRLLNMADYPDIFLRESDAACMSNPTPLLGLPTLVELIRTRHNNGVASTFVGDNLLVVHGGGPHSRRCANVVEKAFAAFKASGKQQVLVSSNATTSDLVRDMLLSAGEASGASAKQLSTLEAAHAALSPFITDTEGRLLAVEKFTFSVDKEYRLTSAAVQHAALDLSALVQSAPDANFNIFNFIVYAFNAEEKERVNITQRHSGFKCMAALSDPAKIAKIRVQYFAFTRALEAVGVEFAMQLSMFSRISAVLHLLDIEFSTEGTPINMACVKSVSRLLQLDFNSFNKLIKTQRDCIILAQELFRATMETVASRVATALNPTGTTSSSALAMIFVPNRPPASSASLLGLPLATFYEDVLQSFFRMSEMELVAWQSAGFCPSPELQNVFDPNDNFSTLKVLKHRKGILFAAQSSGEDQQKALLESNRHSSFKYDPALRILSVKHSFGDRKYHFPGTPEEESQFHTIYHPTYSGLRDYLLQNTDVDTQEALYLVQQQGTTSENPVSQLVAELRGVTSDLLDEQSGFWWIKAVEIHPCGFRGDSLEFQLTECGIHPAVKLRKLLPRRYLSTTAAYIAKAFGRLVSKDKLSLGETQLAEAILSTCSAHYLVTKSELLIEGRTLTALSRMREDALSRAILLVQAQLRAALSAAGLNRRVQVWMEAVQRLENEQTAVQQAYRARVLNQEKNRIEQLTLCEEESTARGSIREQCWIEWVALQTNVNQLVEEMMHRAVMRSIRKEQATITKAVTRNHSDIMTEMAARIHQRLVQQGSHLDHVVASKQKAFEQSQARLLKKRAALEGKLKQRQLTEESRLEVQQALSAKASRATVVAYNREQKKEALRENFWLRHERDRIAREHMEQTRQAMTNQLREQITFDDIQHKMESRVVAEVQADQRRRREELELMLEEERKRKEAMIVNTAKANYRQQVRREHMERSRANEALSRQRREQQQLLAAQERERRALEHMKQQQERQEKLLTRALLKAHEMMQTPITYEQQSRGTSLREKSQDKPFSPPFVTSTGKEVWPRMLSPKTMTGLTSFHSPARQTSPSRALSSIGRTRDASPDSVISI
jgi:hypothetical protein